MSCAGEGLDNYLLDNCIGAWHADATFVLSMQAFIALCTDSGSALFPKLQFCLRQLAPTIASQTLSVSQHRSLALGNRRGRDVQMTSLDALHGEFNRSRHE